MGYKVIEAEDGEEAIKIFENIKDEIQLLLLDVIMPKMKGIDVHDKAIETKPDIKTLFFSGYTEDIALGKEIRDRGLHYIQKPIAPKELLRKVRDVLDK